MQIELHFHVKAGSLLAFNYYHELAAAFYQNLSHNFPEFAHELHDGIHHSRLKLFVFSPLSTEPKPEIVTLSDGKTPALKLGEKVWMRFGSIWPEVAFQLAEGLQKERGLQVRGVHFELTDLQMVRNPEFQPTMTYRPFGQGSCMVCPYEKGGKTLFQFPDNSQEAIPSCAELIAGNLRHKLLRLKEVRPDIFENIVSIGNLNEEMIKMMPITVQFLPLKSDKAFSTRIFQLKDHFVRGFRCPVRLTAPEAVHRIAWECGLGGLNSQGYGLVELGRN